jgi:arginine decarboxylase
MKPETETTTPVVKTPQAQGPSLSAHYLSSRLRFDTWNQLKIAAIHLAEGRGNAEKLRQEVRKGLKMLEPIESYWAFPGRTVFEQIVRVCNQEDFRKLANVIQRVVRALVNQSYRKRALTMEDLDDSGEEGRDLQAAVTPRSTATGERQYFEVLVVDDTTYEGEQALRDGLSAARRPEDPFIYEPVVVPSFEDALIAVLMNTNIQAVVVRYGMPFRSKHRLEVLKHCLHGLDEAHLEALDPSARAMMLGQLINEQRPELDVYLVTDVSLEDTAGERGSVFRRVFYQQEDYLELHLSLLRGVRRRFNTPFFKALREYAEQPTGVFHAMPISRGKSIIKSHWIQDMARFYGMNIFLAETSATSGGLDSLLDPHGPIKEAQELVARAFGARRSYFVTNGTTAANKIVSQGLVRPGDIVLIDRDCHKSHHYAMTLMGAQVVYLDAYPLNNYSMYGAVPLKEIKRALLELKAAGKLDRVRMMILTNCTFDGIVYHPQRVMEECLAIKPDLIFLWDEAWFAFARFAPTYRKRTGMYAAQALQDKFRSPAYAEEYAAAEDKSNLPDPAKVRIRVYATQSTHKTLTSLRQGSMIHVYDQDFHKVEGAFKDAYMTHTSTSPNYQILASLDIGRRQVELEGYELVAKQIELAFTLREKIKTHPLLAKWFGFLSMRELIPVEYRPSGLDMYYNPELGWSAMLEAWEHDEFVLDPTRLTLHIGRTGVDGDTFKKQYLMDRHGIQVNKTTMNSVLFMTNIGTTRSSVAHLIDALVDLANEFEQRIEDESPPERAARERGLERLAGNLPPLPDFSRFHDRFRDGTATPEGDARTAYFLGTNEENCEYFRIDEPAIDEVMKSGRDLVASSFLTPYPPGFPVLVPGQVVSAEILAYLRALDTKEIHGYRADLGIRVFTETALKQNA